MRFIIDTNIVFSALLNPASPIGQIIINGSKHFTFISIGQLKDEIKNHEDKILKISGMNYEEFTLVYEKIKSRIRFVNQLLITKENYQQASELTKEIDPDDVLFVGLSIQLRCKLWSGDKRLLTGLSNKGYNRIMTTEELFKLYLLKEIKHQRH